MVTFSLSSIGPSSDTAVQRSPLNRTIPSGASAALITVGDSHPTSDPLDLLNFESHQLIHEIKEDFDQPIEMVHEGSVYAITDKREYLELKEVHTSNQHQRISDQLIAS